MTHLCILYEPDLRSDKVVLPKRRNDRNEGRDAKAVAMGTNRLIFPMRQIT